MNALENADYAEMARERANAIYSRRLCAHPDPRDPEWPGHAREAHEEDVMEKVREVAAVSRDYLDRAIKADTKRDAEALLHMLYAADEELQEAFRILEEILP